MPWRIRVALLVSESTLLPVRMPLAPAASRRSRIAAQVATVLAAHDLPTAFIQTDVHARRERRFDPTASRRPFGVMSELVHLSTAWTNLDDVPAARPCPAEFDCCGPPTARP